MKITKLLSTQPTVQYTLSHNPEWPLASRQSDPLFTW
jgi:hypothetical protein